MNSDIRKQFNILKEVRPSSEWKEGNRSLLISQITSAQEEKICIEMGVFEAVFKSIMRDARVFLIQPSVVVVGLVAVLIGMPTLSPGIVNNSKPGDSLYIAKKVSEKAQLAITFNENDKAKLGLEFAENRTREITKVLVEFSKTKKDKDGKVQKLTNDFKEEIGKIKTYDVVSVGVDNVGEDKDVDVNESIDDAEGEDVVKVETGAEAKVFSASLSRVEDGIELAENNMKADLHEVLDDAKKMIDNKDYIGTLNKLEEANGIIENVGENGITEVDKVNENLEIVDIIDEIDVEILHATGTAGSVYSIEGGDVVVATSSEVDGIDEEKTVTGMSLEVEGNKDEKDSAGVSVDNEGDVIINDDKLGKEGIGGE